MKTLKRDLQSITKGLKTLLKKTERVERELEKLPGARRGRPPAKTRGTRAAGRSLEQTVTERVYDIIERSRRGATTTQIREKTGFGDKKIWNAINRLKTQEKIKSARKGIYVAM
jgi:hypothetical protein